MFNLKENSIALLHGAIVEEELANLPKSLSVFIMEGRPNLESSEYLVGKLAMKKIKPVLIADNMAGFLFSKNLINEVWLGCSNIDSDGAIAPIGSLILAVLAFKHNIPVKCCKGVVSKGAVGKQRDLFNFKGSRVAPLGVSGYVPLIDFIPSKYIRNCYE